MVTVAQPVTPSVDFPCWCGRNSWRVTFRTTRFGLMRCPDCGCYRIDPPPLASEDESSAFYTDYYAQKGVGAGVVPPPDRRLSRFWSVVEQVPDLLPVQERVADIGCGDGRLCAELHSAGWRSVVGVDVSSTRIERARHSYPDIRFYDRPLEETDAACQSLELTIMDNVIEHLPDPVGMLQRLRGYLEPTGRLVLITPNMESGHFRLLGRRWTPELAAHAHIFLFTQAAIRRLLMQSGYVVETTGSFHLPLYPFRTWMGRWLSGQLKRAVWQGVQESGGLYGRAIGAGPMLYAVARPAPQATDAVRVPDNSVALDAPLTRG